MRFEYQIAGMHCNACVKRVTAALQEFASEVRVTLDPPRVHLTADRQAPIAELNAAVAAVGGYTLAPAEAVDVPVSLPTGNSWLVTYYPLLLIAAYIAVTALAGTRPAGSQFDGAAWMTNVMAGFFLVFSAFKFLDLKGFADAYASYDLGAKRWHAWGYIYPFLELSLGLAYLFRVAPALTDIATIALMGFSSIGVMQALARKQQIRCACLGTVLNVPMSTITLVEDLAMVAMALMSLAMR